MGKIAKTVADVVAGEAVHGTREERFTDMVAIASVIANRARALGVTPQEAIRPKAVIGNS